MNTALTFWGNILLSICAIFYLTWWCITFSTGSWVNRPMSGPLLLAAAVSGIAGIALIINGNKKLSEGLHSPYSLLIIAGSIAAYFILLFLTYLILKRPVTTELFLIIGWMMLELLTVQALSVSSVYTHAGSVIMASALIIVTIINMICYILYYRLEKMASYRAGMIPLILTAVMGLIIAFSARPHISGR